LWLRPIKSARFPRSLRFWQIMGSIFLRSRPKWLEVWR